MQFARQRDFAESEVIKGFDGRGNVKSAVIRAAELKAANEVQQIVLLNAPTGGTFTLTHEGQTTTALPYNETAANVQAALIALSTIDASGVVVTGPNGGPYRVEFSSTEGALPQGQITGNGTALTGGGVGDAHDVLTSTLVQGHAVNAADEDGRYILFEGTIMTDSDTDPTKVVEFTAAGSEAILGILAHRVELFGKTSPDHDRACALFWHNCVFDKSKIKNYATHAAALATALPTCRFE